MMISTKARYAVMAMVYLASREKVAKPVTLAEMSEAQDIPLSFLEQIFMRLRQEKLVKSTRGPGGGYTLAKTSGTTRIDEVITAIEEPISMTRCSQHSTSGCLHDKSRCMTHDLWQGLGDTIYNYFSSITLQDVSERKLAQKKTAPSGAFNATFRANTTEGSNYAL